MSRFHRDHDAEALGAADDVTADTVAGPGKPQARPPRRTGTTSESPTCRTYEEHAATPSSDMAGHRDVEDKQEAALASLRRRMAGPSSGKAGLSMDQEDINRKIYEASKGSKFFENEKRSDERTTQQILAMLARRDRRLAEVPEGSEAWKAAERRIEERAMAIEATRDLSRTILHADMDMFYAAVELKRDPSLKGKAFGVGSGVLVTASYEARKMGCRSGMATHIALALCPHLIIVKNNMGSYVEASRGVMVIFEEYDPNYAQMSLDEAYMDITPYCEMHAITSDDVVTELRQRVQRETGLTVSVGIAPNKMLAKISSDRNKPNGQFRVEADRNFIVDMMHDLPCRKIPGIGRVTERVLASLGVNTCGDVWSSRTMLHLTLGDIDWLYSAYLGIHSNVVEPAKRGERRSVGREHTFRPTSNVSDLKDFLRQSAVQVARDLERLDYRGKTITLTCKTDKFQRFTRAKTVLSYKHKEDDLYDITSKLFDAEVSARGGPFSMRLIGVRVSGLKDLREPEKGGIKNMLSRTASTSPQKRHQRDVSDMYVASADNDEDFEQAMQLALKQSMAECQSVDVGEENASPPPPDDITLKRLDARCPVCHKYLVLPQAEATDDHSINVLMNAHIDRCLLGNAVKDVSALPQPLMPNSREDVTSLGIPDTLERPSKKRRTLDSFFKKT